MAVNTNLRTNIKQLIYFSLNCTGEGRIFVACDFNNFPFNMKMWWLIHSFTCETNSSVLVYHISMRFPIFSSSKPL